MVKSKYTPEQKVQIVLESIKTSISTAELCRKHNVHPQTFHTWRVAFMDAGKSILSHRGKNNPIKAVKKENDTLKRLVGEQAMVIDVLKKPWRRKIEGRKATK